MSEGKSGMSVVILGVAALGLVGLIGWDQMRQHPRPAPPEVATVPISPDDLEFEAADTTGGEAVPEEATAPTPAAADTTREDRLHAGRRDALVGGNNARVGHVALGQRRRRGAGLECEGECDEHAGIDGGCGGSGSATR